MIKYKLSVFLAIASLLVVGVIAFAEEIIILEQTIGSRGYWITSEPGWNQPAFAQTFVSPVSGALKRVELRACGEFKLHFYEIPDALTAPDFPNGSPMATFPVSGFCSRSELATALTVSDGLIFIAGQTYAMVIESPNASIVASDLHGAQDVYPSGMLMFYKNGTWFNLGGDLVVRIWDDPLPPPVKNIGIDIKPGSDANPINLKSRGVIPVAIISEEDFDAITAVDQSSLRFGKTGDEKNLQACGEPRDVNEDSLLDLVCVFETEKVSLQIGDSEGILRGKTASGELFEGKDFITVK